MRASLGARMSGARIFISYKTGANSGITFQARTIADKLRSIECGGNDVWMDASDMEAGLDWNTQIYERIPQSDIVLLMLAAETSTSEWVRREIDVAKGAKVTILPVLIRGDFDLQATLDSLDIPRVQAVSLLTGSQEEYDDLVTAIAQRGEETAERQLAWLHTLRESEEAPRREIVPAEPSLAVYSMPGEIPEIHLAGGDMTEFRHIDVLVNSENDYMQMARTFDGRRSVSSTLRYLGSCFDRANRLLEDTIQNELNLIVECDIGPRPLGLYTVVVTSAGHFDSELRTINKVRYVFHAATVSVQGDGANKRLEPISSESGVRRIMRSLLLRVHDVNEQKGVVSPKGTPQREEQETAKDAYEPIRSIALPMFGTGRGGLTVAQVTPAVARGIKEFLLDDEQTTLERIHVCGFFEDDVVALDAALRDEFDVVEPLALTDEAG